MKKAYFSHNEFESNAFLGKGKKHPITILATWDPAEKGVSVRICYGHEVEIFEDPNAVKIDLLDVLQAACVWAEGNFMEGVGEYRSKQVMATYLRSLAEFLEFEAEDLRGIDRAKKVPTEVA